MAKHTNEGETCPSCEEKLLAADPRLSDFFHHIQNNGFRDAHISCSWRGEEDQNRLFSSGFSKEKWPNSKHNFLKEEKPFSQAIDLFILLEDGEASFSGLLFGKIYASMHENPDFKIRWGGDFKDLWPLTIYSIDKFVATKRPHEFIDCPHFELRESPS